MLQYAKARELFDLVLTVARATNDRRSVSETLQNIANAYYFQATCRTRRRPPRISPGRWTSKPAPVAGTRDGRRRGDGGVAAGPRDRRLFARRHTPALRPIARLSRSTRSGTKGPRSGGRSSASATCSTCRRTTTRPPRPTAARWACSWPASDPQGAGFARSGLARVFAAQGDLAAALDSYGQVLADARARLQLIARGADRRRGRAREHRRSAFPPREHRPGARVLRRGPPSHRHRCRRRPDGCSARSA